jgi:hypothetical protein
VQEVRIDSIGSKVLERADERLPDLDSHGGSRIVGKSVILSPPERELRLQEQIIPDQHAVRDRPGDSLPDGCFVVVAALVGGIDTPEPQAQGELRKPLGTVPFPRGSVQETGG